MSELPNGWIEVTLGQITSKPQYGYTTKSQSSGSVRYLRTTDLTSGKVNWDNVPYCVDNPADVSKYQLEDRDIVISRAGSVGFHSLICSPPANVVFASYLIRFKPSSFVNERYLSRFLNSQAYWSQITEKAAGVAVQNVNAVKLADLRIPLAPLNEQIRIADKLDSIQAKVDRAQARLDQIPGILKRFRQTVLAAATSGELTREWRGETSDKKTIYSTWEIVNLPETWEVKLLPEVATTRLGKMLDKNKNEGIATKYIGNINVRWNSFDLEDLKEILVSEKEISELSILDGDLILCEGGVPGRGAVWRGGKNNLVFQKALHRIRFNDTVLPEFGLYCVEDDFNSNKLAALYTGTTIKHLTGQALSTYPLRIPPIEEQREIVSKVEVLLAKAAQAESQFIKSKVMFDRLTQSILAKAFRGELVTQDPNDKPASEMLKRIKSLDISTKPKKKSIPKLNVASPAKTKIAQSAIPDDLERFESTITTDFDAGKHEVIDRLRVSYQTEIQKAQELLVDAKFSVEQFRSMTDFQGGYDELKALIMNLLKGIPSLSEPLLAIESWDEKSGGYLMHLVKQK